MLSSDSSLVIGLGVEFQISSKQYQTKDVARDASRTFDSEPTFLSSPHPVPRTKPLNPNSLLITSSSYLHMIAMLEIELIKQLHDHTSPTFFITYMPLYYITSFISMLSI